MGSFESRAISSFCKTSRTRCSARPLPSIHFNALYIQRDAPPLMHSSDKCYHPQNPLRPLWSASPHLQSLASPSLISVAMFTPLQIIRYLELYSLQLLSLTLSLSTAHLRFILVAAFSSNVFLSVAVVCSIMRMYLFVYPFPG